MTREEIITRVSKYFSVKELVSQKVYTKYKEESIQFIQTDALHCLLIIREGINDYCTINNWHKGGNRKESGLRANVDSIFKSYFKKNKLYLSGHVLGCAFDMLFKNTSADDVRSWIVENEHLFPCKIRLEHLKNGKPISWTHFDTKQLERLPKVYLFNV